MDIIGFLLISHRMLERESDAARGAACVDWECKSRRKEGLMVWNPKSLEA